jgi:hypothetical protein
VDPAAALILADAATESLEAGDANQADREGVESDLTRTIRLILPAEEDFEEAAGEDGAHGPVELGDGLADEALSRLDSAGQRVMMARRFHNDAVTDVLRLRRNVFVRLFFLAGHTDLPRTVEFDDDLGASEGAVR